MAGDDSLGNLPVAGGDPRVGRPDPKKIVSRITKTANGRSGSIGATAARRDFGNRRAPMLLFRNMHDIFMSEAVAKWLFHTGRSITAAARGT
jgi:hypothetical protein